MVGPPTRGLGACSQDRAILHRDLRCFSWEVLGSLSQLGGHSSLLLSSLLPSSFHTFSFSFLMLLLLGIAESITAAFGKRCVSFAVLTTPQAEKKKKKPK